MKSEAIVLPYYGIGDFLTHLPFVLAIAKKNRKSKFIVLTKRIEIPLFLRPRLEYSLAPDVLGGSGEPENVNLVIFGENR